jgi:hypothetical protein
MRGHVLWVPGNVSLLLVWAYRTYKHPALCGMRLRDMRHAFVGYLAHTAGSTYEGIVHILLEHREEDEANPY